MVQWISTTCQFTMTHSRMEHYLFSYLLTCEVDLFENAAIVAIKRGIVTFIHVKSIKVTSAFNLRAILAHQTSNGMFSGSFDTPGTPKTSMRYTSQVSKYEKKQCSIWLCGKGHLHHFKLNQIFQFFMGFHMVPLLKRKALVLTKGLA